MLVARITGLLALAGSAREKMADVIRWGVILMIAGFVLGVGVMVLRKRMLSKRDATPQPWTLEQLRELRRRGEISDEEFENLRLQLVSDLSRTQPTSAGPDAS